MVELIDLVGPVLIFLFQTAFLKILISLLVSLTVILTVKDGFISIVWPKYFFCSGFFSIVKFWSCCGLNVNWLFFRFKGDFSMFFMISRTRLEWNYILIAWMSRNSLLETVAIFEFGNRTRTHNHLVHKRISNHWAKSGKIE